MKSVKCPECGFVGWADAECCKRCLAPVAAQDDVPDQIGSEQTYHDPAQPVESDQTYYYPRQPVGSQPKLKQGLAIASLVIGILNLLFLGIFGITIVAGIVISVIALKRVKHYPFQYGGRQLAVAGLVTNIVSVVILVPILMIAAIAIPNLLASRRAANEGTAINSLRKIYTAERAYQLSRGAGSYGDLTDLMREGMIPTELGSGTKSGYRFKVETVRDRGDGYPGFSVVGVPTEYGSTGRLSFYVDESAVIRAADNQGMEATKYDPELNSPAQRSASRRAQPAIED
jgi:type IV pilus assembly protein PilA